MAGASTAALLAATAMRAGLGALGMAAADIEAPCLLPAAYCILSLLAAYRLLRTACCLLPTAFVYCLCLLLTTYRLPPTAYCLLPTAYCLLLLAAYYSLLTTDC